MNHFTSPKFWFHYRQLPEAIRELADKNFAILKSGPDHRSLHFKRIGNFWTVRVGLHYRAVAKEREDGIGLVLDRTPPRVRKPVKTGLLKTPPC